MGPPGNSNSLLKLKTRGFLRTPRSNSPTKIIVSVTCACSLKDKPGQLLVLHCDVECAGPAQA